jgi:hypothetical protein
MGVGVLLRRPFVTVSHFSTNLHYVTGEAKCNLGCTMYPLGYFGAGFTQEKPARSGLVQRLRNLRLL